MNINTELITTMTEANQNFSKVAKVAENNGRAVIFKNNKLKDTPDYNKALLINYFSNQAFSFLFFTLKSPFLALIDTFIVFISSLFLYYESKELNKTSAKLLIPYIIWNLFALILIITIFFMNL